LKLRLVVDSVLASLVVAVALNCLKDVTAAASLVARRELLLAVWLLGLLDV
jgi:hypothetical protein